MDRDLAIRAPHSGGSKLNKEGRGGNRGIAERIASKGQRDGEGTPLLWSISSWSAVVFMLSVGARYLNANHKVLAYANEAVLPFYLFHQTVILVVGSFVVRWGMGILPKLLIVTVVSFPLILGAYELLVRRFDAVRFLFGMRPKEKRPAVRGATSGRTLG